ncbi:MAG: NAD(P)/FAD-dependent oxidoreductase, partial [Candidatus Dormibacteraeota bacterium]|nr:NAD(P)/FAD-dependent oxidoreductase [Candidatus Dormibacteraeota bacterium]
IKLKEAGIDDFVVLERAGDVGGTWRDNTYPGCECDVPSFLYSFSFAPNPDWTCTYPKQPEIWEYLRACAERFGVLPHVRLHHAMRSAGWDEESERWIVEAGDETFESSFLVLGTGGLSEPRLPDIAGVDRFAGTMFHSAQWRHDHDLRGKRVATIGTGASAIQFIPRVQPLVDTMFVFQRTPAWVLPHPNRSLHRWERAVSRSLPLTLGLRRFGVYVTREMLVPGFTIDPRLTTILERVALRHLRSQVHDDALRAELTPTFRLGCKRLLISNDYYPALTKPNVELVTERIVEVRPHSIVTADRREREVDTIIAGTGFRVSDMPVAHLVHGRSDRTLDDVWDGSPQAYLGTTVAGFPNLFFLSGPNTGLGHTSLVYMIESQIAYVLDAIAAARRHDVGTIEVKAEVQRAYNADIQQRMRRTVWTTGGCASWYIDSRGRNTTLWPDFTWPFHRRTGRFDVAAYELRRSARVHVAA